MKFIKIDKKTTVYFIAFSIGVVLQLLGLGLLTIYGVNYWIYGMILMIGTSISTSSLLYTDNYIRQLKMATEIEEIIKTKRAHCKIHKGEEHSFLAGKWEAYSNAIEIIKEQLND